MSFDVDAWRRALEADARVWLLYTAIGALTCIGVGVSIGVYADRHPWFRSTPETIVYVTSGPGVRPDSTTLSAFCASALKGTFDGSRPGSPARP
jgi:hypothetical protein